MATWKKERLESIGANDDLHIAPFREDGITTGTPTWIWSVVVDGDVYVRAYNGTSSSWYKAALKQKGGAITSAGATDSVKFEAVTGPLNDSIDEAYKIKYSSSPYLKPMIGDRARGATFRVTPTD